MDILISIVVSFIVLLISVYKNISIAYPLIGILFLFSILAYKRGFKIKEIIAMTYRGGKKSFIVLEIFVLIGAITAVWMSAGTVPAIVYYGVKFLQPDLFILYAFIISSFVSVLIGTSFGTISTVGVALMVMARSGNVNLNITAGAVIAGAYFGDRCSPMSSSANLVAILTETEIYTNIKNMITTSIIPIILTCIVYLFFSFKYPLRFTNNALPNEITNVFSINLIVLIPAFIIILFSIFKVNVKISMLISIVTAMIISLVFQHYALIKILKYIVLGFKIDKSSPLSNVITGGGIISMLNVSIIVFISSALAGIFEETRILYKLEEMVKKAHERYQILIITTIISIAAAAFGCTQAIAIILTNQIVKNAYDEKKIDRTGLAVDIENTAEVLSPLIPWNIAGLVPATILMVHSGFIPYAFYLYIIPIVNIIYLKFVNKKSQTVMA